MCRDGGGLMDAARPSASREQSKGEPGFVPAGAGADVWTRPRRELLDWFRRNDAPALGELYEGAVELLLVLRVPGRLRFVCHAVREIRNRLPDVVTGARNSGRFDYLTPLDELAADWNAHGLGAAPGAVGQFSAEGGEVNPSTALPIPVPVVEKIRRLLAGHVTARERKADAAKRLFEGCCRSDRKTGDAQYVAVSEWLRVTDWFESKTHQPCEQSEAVDWGEVERRFEHFEAALYSLLGRFFTTVDALDEILGKANT